MQLGKVMGVSDSGILLQVIHSYIFHPLEGDEVHLCADARVHGGTDSWGLSNRKPFKFLTLKGTWDHSFHLKVLWGYFAVFLMQKELFLKGAHCFCFPKLISLDILHCIYLATATKGIVVAPRRSSYWFGSVRFSHPRDKKNSQKQLFSVSCL